MNRILHAITASVIAAAMVASPVVEAQTRGRHVNSTEQKNDNPRGNRGQKPAFRGDKNNRPARPSNNNRPARPDKAEHHKRPGRPGLAGNRNDRDNSLKKHHRPDRHKPGMTHRPERPKPGVNHHHNRPERPYNNGHHYGHYRPHKHDHHYHHHVPFFGRCHRPVPPPHWHCHGRGPSFGTILGIALGTAIYQSINSLINSGYAISSYGNDVIYLTNVPQMNYTWNDAALYYNNGLLYGSQFTYTTPYHSLQRYNALYNMLTAQYGMPIQSVNQGNMISATWFGAGNRFVTLSFTSQYGGAYYTTLSFGN